MRDAMKNTGAMLLGLALLAALSFLLWGWLYSTAGVRGAVQAELKIESGDNRISSYEHFYDLCAAVQGYEQALIAQRAALAAGSDTNRTNANIAGITAQRARAIAQYNADANKSYTKARFLGDTLPRRLDVNLETTQCN